MRIKSRYILYCINIVTIALTLIIALLPNNIPRIILSLPVVLFFPGYTLLAALFPRRGSLGSVERILYSFGLSLAITPFGGLILNYTPWGIRLHPILIFLFSFIITMSVIACYRERRLSEEENISLNVQRKFPSLVRLWSIQNRNNKIFTVLLIVVILGAFGAAGYVFSLPRYYTKYTEFYFSENGASAANSTLTITAGQNITVILGIINHEKETDTYRIEIIINGDKVKEVDNIALNNEQKWEQEVSFVLTQVGTKKKMQCLLYKGSDLDIYRQLALWVNVLAGK